MAHSGSLDHSNLSAEDIAVARRLREERIAQKFSFSEFAREVGISRSALSNYEYGFAALPFEVAMKICSRLNLSPRWLATGAGPKRPFIDLDSIGLPGFTVPRRAPFSEIYKTRLATRYEAWFQATKEDDLIQAQIEAGPAGIIRRLSDRALHQFAREWLARLNTELNQALKLPILGNVEMALREMRNRLEGAGARDISVDPSPKLGLATDIEFATPMEIATRIKDVRKQCNLSQSQAAKQWEIPLKTLKNWEQGVASPRGFTGRQLESILSKALTSSKESQK